MGNEIINSIAQVLDQRMKQNNERPPLLDFGTIKEDSLITNQFPVPIPTRDCVICASAKGYNGRVFVAWVGDDPVVVSPI